MASFCRVMSTGDLTLIRDEEQQPRLVAPPVRYSAEERRERIDKYRSKRNQRNFQKKITVRSVPLCSPFRMSVNFSSIYLICML